MKKPNNKKNQAYFQNLNCIALLSWQIKRICPLFTIKKHRLSRSLSHTHKHTTKKKKEKKHQDLH